MSMRKLWTFAMLCCLSLGLVACDQGGDAGEGEVPPVVEEGEGEGAEPEDGEEGTEGEMEGEDEGDAGEDEAAAPSTDRTGTWLDSLTVVEEPSADAAVSRLEAGDIDVYAFTISSPSTYQRILETEGVEYKTSYGSYNELTFNPAVCADTSKINPFSVPRIREAMNWLVDRDYIVEEIMGGLGTPRYVPINGASADRGTLAAEIRQIEAAYAHDAERAEQVVTEEMEALGAERVDGLWTYQGEPVEIIGIIRSEDERTQIGDYFASQLESIGFTVLPDYKTSAEAAPIWQQSEPTECLFGYYTGGWVSTAISRDAATNFNFFYTPSGLPRPLWQAYSPTEEFAEIAQRLFDADFSSLEERTELFAQALPMALEDSVRIWLLDRSSVAPYREGVSVSADLSGSIYGTMLWPYTLRLEGEEGGELTWASASILTEPWNPIAGTNWIYDSTLYRSTGQWSFMPDPNTGLNWPQRFESFEVTVQEGLPVGKTLDWVELNFEPEIAVPDDAWADWDAESQTFVTAADHYTETNTTALVKTVTTYPADLFETTTWHDGSPMSVGDMVMSLIMNFDQAKEASAVYDEAQVPALDSFMSTFKGIRITSTDPVTVEFYTDNWSLDAENAISNLRSLWPYYGFGEAPWHTVALGIAAEAGGQAAFSADKATANEVEQLSYIAGPTLETLSTQLASLGESELPYAATLSEYIDAEEIAARAANLQAWYDERGHFWVGTGPLVLDRAFPVEGTVVLERNPDFPDPADKWARFEEPAIATVEIDGPGRVTGGDEAVFDVAVSFDGEPYAIDDISEVKYLLFDASGALVDSGNAEAVEDGAWQVTLGSDTTSGLDAGSNRIEVIVVSQIVALPSLGAMDFVSTP